MVDSRRTTGSAGGFGLRAIIFGGRDGRHGFVPDGFCVAAGCKGCVLGFTPVVRGGWFIFEVIPQGRPFGDLLGSPLGAVCEKKKPKNFTPQFSFAKKGSLEGRRCLFGITGGYS